MATIAGLYLYPVKSCAGIALDEAVLGPAGFESHGVADREWMVADAATGQFRTQRQWPRMALIRTAITDGALILDAPGMPALPVPLHRQPAAPPIKASVWDHECPAFDEGDDAGRWLSDFLGSPVRLVRFDSAHKRLSNPEWTGGAEVRNRFSDGYPILMIAEASLADLNGKLRKAGRDALPMNRFRPNLVLDDVGPYDEDRLEHLAGDGLRLRPVKPCPRCPIPSIDQATGERGADPLDILSQYRRDARTGGVVFGQNVIVTEGYGRTLRVGQTLAEAWNF
jgi:uncharacterized protein YcbX